MLGNEKNIKNIIAQYAKVVEESNMVDTRENRIAEYRYKILKHLPKFCNNFMKKI